MEQQLKEGDSLSQQSNCWEEIALAPHFFVLLSQLYRVIARLSGVQSPQGPFQMKLVPPAGLAGAGQDQHDTIL